MITGALDGIKEKHRTLRAGEMGTLMCLGRGHMESSPRSVVGQLSA